ncbi:MAG TPA: carboxypeptidase regulatory-like domain-containing protein [Thermoanaerobaculia bacterium]|nr:carboxypeptidase regulatory-like domain-containing protein [Thermoanaerobaculia bacterium]
MRVRWFIALFVFTACETMRPSAPLRGMVVDPNRVPVAGADVLVEGRTVAVTGADGAFSLRSSPRARVAVTVRAPRYTTTTKVLARRSDGGINTVVIWPRAAAQRIRGSDGGRLTFPGAIITIPPNAFVDAYGGRVPGAVDIALTTVDLNNRRQLDAAPGDFTARMRDGSIRRLETFGLFEFAAESDGRALEFARGKAAAVQLEMRAGAREAVPAFRFDPPSGLWIQQPTPWQGGTVAVPAPGWWNADDPLTTTCIRVQVLDCKLCDVSDTVVAGATVSATGADYTGAVTTDTTDPNDPTDLACLFVKASAHVVLKVAKVTRVGESVEVATPQTLASVCDQSCPLTVVHLNDAAIAPQMPLNDSSSWCATNDRANGGPFDTVWSDSAAHVSASPSAVTLMMDPCTLANCHSQPYASGEYKSKCFHGYGTYGVTITPPTQQWDTTLNDSKLRGLVTAFFTYTDSHDGTIGDGIPNWHD